MKRLQVAYGPIVLGLVSLVLIGCGAPPVTPSLADQLQGRWKLVSEPRAPNNRIEFHTTSDSGGTFEFTIPSIVTLTFKGTWQLTDRTLTWRYREVPDLVRWGEQLGGSQFPETMTFTVVRITATELVLKKLRGVTEERYERIPQ